MSARQGLAAGTLNAQSQLVATAPEPTADIDMTLADYSFTMSAPLTAGHHVVLVENAAGQAHEVAIFRLEPGNTDGKIHIMHGMMHPFTIS